MKSSIIRCFAINSKVLSSSNITSAVISSNDSRKSFCGLTPFTNENKRNERLTQKKTIEIISQGPSFRSYARDVQDSTFYKVR